MKKTKCCHYRLTGAGKTALVERLHNLTAKQRQFLFMLQKKETINQAVCKHLSNSININKLITLGLISLETKQPRQLKDHHKNTELFANHVIAGQPSRDIEISMHMINNYNNQSKALNPAQYKEAQSQSSLCLDDLPTTS